MRETTRTTSPPHIARSRLRVISHVALFRLHAVSHIAVSRRGAVSAPTPPHRSTLYKTAGEGPPLAKEAPCSFLRRSSVSPTRTTLPIRWLVLSILCIWEIVRLSPRLLDTNRGYLSLVRVALLPPSARSAAVHNTQASLGSVLDRDPSDWRAYYGLGLLAGIVEGDGAGVDAWRRAAALAPTNRVVAYQLGSAYESLGDHAQALKAWQRARAETRFTTLAHFYLRSGNAGSALESYRLALKVDPNYEPARHGYGELLVGLARADLQAGDLHQADRNLRAALQWTPTSWQAWQLLAQVLLRQRRAAEAEAALLRALELNLQDPWAYSLLGDAYGQQQRTFEAQRAYRQAIVLFEHALQTRDSDMPRAFERLGDAYAAVRRWQQAADAYGESIRQDPLASAPYAKMGDVLCRLGDPGAALRYYQLAAGSGGNQVRVRFAIEYISTHGFCPTALDRPPARAPSPPGESYRRR